jgi:hypothetical protein
LQFVVSPVIGHFADAHRWGTVVWMLSLPPLVAWGLLRVTFRGGYGSSPR